MNPLMYRRVRGPVFLLCFAVTAILDQWHYLSFARSWPLYLLVAGLLHLLEAMLPIGLASTAYGAQGFPAGVPLRRRSLTGAVVEILAGALALLFTTGVLALDNFWRVYAVWWPLVLIVLGLLLLLERLFDGLWARRATARYPAAGVYIPRRRGGLGWLVAFLVALGLLSHAASFAPFSSHAWDSGWNWSLNHEVHENDVSLQQPIAADAVLTVENAHGDLQIAPSTDGRIHVDAHQVAHVADRDKESAFRDTRPELTVHGASAEVRVPGRNNVEVRLVVAVPEGVLCTIHNHHGDIAISGLRRALEISQEHGDVALDSLGGPVHLVMDHGDVAARALASDLAIDGRANDIAASDIRGRTLLHGEFFGDTQLDGLGGPVEFHSSHTTLDAEHVTGAISLDSEDLHITGAEHGLRLTTRSKEVEITDLSGDAEITNNNSDLTVSTRQPLGTLRLVNSTGNISLSVPAGASFSMQGQTGEDDEIVSEFGLAQSNAGGEKTLAGQVGQGGPHIAMTTRHGDLTLRRSAAVTAGNTPGAGLPGPDAPDPVAPGKPPHVRHLQSAGEPPAATVQ